MSMPLLILLFGFLYALLVGLLSFLRREGLSAQFAIESIVITLIFSALAAYSSIVVHPVVFLIIIYLLTMRVRLLVDVGNSFARRSNFKMAENIYHLAESLWPDRAGRLIVEINRGTLCLQKGDLDGSIEVFKAILETDQSRASRSQIRSRRSLQPGASLSAQEPGSPGYCRVQQRAGYLAGLRIRPSRSQYPGSQPS